MRRKGVVMSELLALAIGALALAVGIWDFAVVSWGDPQDTVSNIIGQWSHAFPALPFGAGLLMGHLFWPRVPPQ